MVDEGLGVTLLPENMVDTAVFPDLLVYPLEEPLDTLLGVAKLKHRILPLEAELLYNYFSGEED